MNRPSWDTHFMNIAHTTAEMSTCPRAQVGCVIVNSNKHILSTGHNGSVAGQPHCDEMGCLMVDDHCVRCLHAEMNAIVLAARNGHNLRGGVVYVTHYPCQICAKMLINLGAVKVYYHYEYGDTTLSQMFFSFANIPTERLDYAATDKMGG